MLKESGKGMGVSALAEHLGLTTDQVICVGDAENDLEMIKLAGLGVTIANSTDELKVIANYISTSNKQDGVAQVFDKFILNAS